MLNSPQLNQLSDLQFTHSSKSFNDSWQSSLAILLGLGKAAGADHIEFFLQRTNYLNCLVENNSVTAINPILSLGAGVRVFKGKKDCYVSTNDVTFSGLKKILENALDIHSLEMTANRIVPEINLEPLRDYGKFKNKEKLFSQLCGVSQICDILLNCNQQQKEKTKHLQSATTNFFQDWQEILVASSDGIFARDIRLNQSLSASVSCVLGAHRTNSSKRLGCTTDPLFLPLLNFDSLAESLAERAGHMLQADYVSAGNYPVVIANGFGGVIFHEACGHLLETTAVQNASTPFKDKMGQRIAQDCLTAWDEGQYSNAFGSLDMDDEGMPAQKTLLIENGILRNFLCDRAGQLLTGFPRTGSGRRQNYSYAPASRMRNTYIGPGANTPEEIISSVDKGLYCKNLGGGSVDSTGSFNFAVEEAWLIENGKVTKPAKGATLIGQAAETLQNISMVGNDLGLAAGFCGSVSGSVYVTVGQPHLKVDSITVGGR